MSDDDEQFRMIAGQYGAVEAQMGQDGYAAGVDLTKSQTEHNRKQIELMEHKKMIDAELAESVARYNTLRALMLHSVGQLIRTISVCLFLLTVWFIASQIVRGVT